MERKMTLDLGASDERNVFYLNFEKIGVLDFQGERKDQPDLGLFGTEIVPNDQFCEAEQNFNFDALIENGSNWLLSIERLRLPLQGIPMLDGDEKEVLKKELKPIRQKLFDLQMERFSKYINDRGKVENLPIEEEELQREMTELTIRINEFLQAD